MARYIILQDANPQNPFPGPQGSGCWDTVTNSFVPWYVCGGLGRKKTPGVLSLGRGSKSKTGCNCKKH